MAEILFAAQPIYDRRGHIYSHELLYRHDSGITALDVGDERATSELLFNLCTGVIEHVEHYKMPVCINVSADFLLSGIFLPLNPKDVIVELIERIEPTPEIIAAIRTWVDEGFRFALDDFEFHPSWDPILKMATIIKVDITRTSFEEAAERYHSMRDYPVLWLAEKIEEEATYEKYKDLGFDLFQGFYLAKPKVIEGRKVPSAAGEQAMIIQQLFSEEPDLYDLVAAISTDPLLVVNLLRIANSPYYGVARKIESVREVVMLLGLEPLRKWVLLILSLRNSTPGAAKLVLTRAYMCAELMRQSAHGSRAADVAFLVGLLSGCDILLDVNKNEFVNELNISSSVRDAVLSYFGELGEQLRSVEDFEYSVAMKRIDLADPELFQVYKQSHFLVDELFQAMEAA